MQSLAVFMTFGGSLEIWRSAGILERELALYAEHADQGVDVVLVSYGGPDEVKIASDFPFVRVLCNRIRLHPRIYNEVMPWLHRNALNDVDLIKTNQLFGARQAVRAARMLRRPVVVRQGYGFVQHALLEHGVRTKAHERALAYEKTWLPKADLCQFTSPAVADDCVERLGLDPARCIIVPNYIETAIWTPPFDNFADPDTNAVFRLCFWGRFEAQKNLNGLIEAVAGLPVELVLIGEGSLRMSLDAQARALNVRVTFLDRMPQSLIRQHASQCHAFVLPSHYEGHPKALIEAMALRMPVLVANSPGITGPGMSDIVRDSETAIVAETSAPALHAAVRRMMSLTPEDRQAMAMRAHTAAVGTYHVAAVARRERDAYAALVGAVDGSPPAAQRHAGPLR